MAGKPVAIVGVAAELPSGDHSAANLDYDGLWPFLLEGKQAYERIPLDRFNIETWQGTGPGRITPSHGTFLKDVSLFDHVEFGITSKDARALPLSTRKLLELSFLALLDSGISYRGRHVGCFTSGVTHDVSILSDTYEHDAQGTFAYIPSMMANRISYHLDLTGPSIALDTACSSTLTAMHLAVQSIASGECESAIVGGCQLNHRLDDWIQYSQGSVLSKDGKCKPFDANADGFSRGEGAAVVVLKSLEDALRDNDHIYATVVGSAITATGSPSPVYAPVAAAQCDAMLRAYAGTGRHPSEVDFVECHATGTAAGDPLEANWVGEQFQRDDEIICGSVKGNFGHTEITAFLTSLLKSTHIFRHQLIPPNVNLSTPNPKIEWAKYKLRVPTESPVALGCRSSRRPLISISSWGIGGAGGHIVLEAPEEKTGTASKAAVCLERPSLLVAAGLSPRTASAVATSIQQFVGSQSLEHLPAISAHYGRCARQMPWRSFAVVDPQAPLTWRFTEPQLVSTRSKPLVAFVFSGQGPQHIHMGRQMFAMYPAFRQSILELDTAYAAAMGKSLVETSGLFAEQETDASKSALSEWTVALPALTMVQIACFDLLASLGVKPDIVLGHSAGETALIYASGAGPKELALMVAIARAKMMSDAERIGGTMVAVSCSVAVAQPLVEEVLVESGREKDAKELVVACHNALEAVTVAGLSELVDAIILKAEANGILARKLRIPVPVHSPLMDAVQDQCLSLLADVFAQYPGCGRPKIPTYSTVSGKLMVDELFDADYFWNNARCPVLFEEVLTHMQSQDRDFSFVELSPHPVLSSYIASMSPASNGVSCVLRRPTKTGSFIEAKTFLECVGTLTSRGVSVDYDALNDYPTRSDELKFPSYPFQKKHVSYHSEHPSFYQRFLSRNGPLNCPRLQINADTHPLLAKHVINDVPIMPAAGFIEMGLEFGARALYNVEFPMALPLNWESPMTVEVDRDGPRWWVKTSSSLVAHRFDEPWVWKGNAEFDRLHAHGLLSFDDPYSDDTPLDLVAIRDSCPSLFDTENIYEKGFKGFASFGPEYHRMSTCFLGEDQVLAEFRGGLDISDLHLHKIHPVVLDSVFHACMCFIIDPDEGRSEYGSQEFWLPSKAGSVILHDTSSPELEDTFVAHLVLRNWSPDEILVDIFIAGSSGTRICTIYGFVMTKHSSAVNTVQHGYTMVWQPVAIPFVYGFDLPTREPNYNSKALYQALDDLAVNTIRNSLAKGVTTGPEVHRQRYLKFAEEAAKRDVVSSKDIRLLETLRSQYPSYFDITERVSAVHPGVFVSPKAIVEALYSDTETMADFYGPQNTVAGACKDNAAIFQKALSTLLSSGKKVVRVLEIGCGTGMLTEYLCDIAPSVSGVTVEYVASDISLALAAQAAKRANYPYMRAQQLDITLDPQDQGIQLESFDIIVGLHVLHAAPDLTAALAYINALLVPGGFFLLTDFDGSYWEQRVSGTLWYDFLFGSFAEWFGFTDGRNHCTLPVGSWKKKLSEHGLRCIDLVSAPPEEDLSITFIAQKEGQGSIFSQPSPISSNGYKSDGSETEESADVNWFDFHYVPPTTLHYKRGEETSLRDAIAGLDSTRQHSIWLVAVEGPDADFALGLSRSLRGEFPLWTLHLVIVDGQMLPGQQEEAIFHLQCMGNVEPEIKLAFDGRIYVPKLVRLPDEPLRSIATSVEDAGLLSDNQTLTIDVLGHSNTEGTDCRIYFGRVTESGSEFFEQGARVIALGYSPPATSVKVHIGCVYVVEEDVIVENLNIVSLIVSALALGGASLSRPGKLQTVRQVLVTDVTTYVGAGVVHCLTKMGLDVFALSSKLNETDGDILASDLTIPRDHVLDAFPIHASAKSRKFDYIISGAIDPLLVQRLSLLLSDGGRLHLWDGPDDLRNIVKNDPWSVGAALEAGLRIVHLDDLPCVAHTTSSCSRVETILPQVQSSLFSPDKTYILVGGVGGIGIPLALWMTQKGARDIVLTSRSGKERLRQPGNLKNLRILNHLESLPGLSVRVAAVDATDWIAMSELVKGLERPIGGCFLMTLVLSDRLFVNQTEESFRTVMASKVDAFRVVSSVIDMSSLDFFVSLSSVAALFGSPGQSNYTSASSALEGWTSKYSNAFSLSVPGIQDSGWLLRDQARLDTRSSHYLSWGIKMNDLCSAIENGIRRLAHATMDLYIPDLPWNSVATDIGHQPIFRHLCTWEDSGPRESLEGGDPVQAMILHTLRISEDDFSASVPFTSYGLDSLMAARLSADIQTHLGVRVTQLQLLSDMSFKDLERVLESKRGEDGS